MALGLLWTMLQTIIGMLLFTFIFGKMVGLSGESIPFTLLTFNSRISWTFLQNSCNFASKSLFFQMPMISKVYSPLAPSFRSLTSLLGLRILRSASSSFFITMASYGVYQTAKILFKPLNVLLTLATIME